MPSRSCPRGIRRPEITPAAAPGRAAGVPRGGGPDSGEIGAAPHVKDWAVERVVKLNVLIYDMLEFENMNGVFEQFFPVDPPVRTV